MRKRSNILSVPAVLSLLIICGCGKKDDTAAAPPPSGPRSVLVTAAQVTRGPIRQTATFLGTIRWGRRVTLQTGVSGKIASTADLSPGSRFSKGDLLVEVNPTDYELNVREGEAALAQGKARLAELKMGTRPEVLAQLSAAVDREKALLLGVNDRLERARTLLAQKVRTEADVVAAQSEWEAAKARLADVEAKLAEGRNGETAEAIAVGTTAVAVAEAELASAQNLLVKCRLLAPFDGVVVERVRQAGDRVQIADSVAVLVAEPLEAWLEVPEQLVGAMPAAGEKIDVRSGGARGRTFPATVAALIPVADNATRNATLRLILDPGVTGVAEGMSVQADLSIGESDQALLVPLDAVTFGRHGAVIHVIGPENKINVVPVKVGLRTDTQVEITGAVEVGAQVVTTGNEVLYPGALVEVAPPPGTAAPAPAGGAIPE